MYDRSLYISGEKVSLLALTEEHTPLVVKWRSNPEVSKNLYTQTAITAESHLRYFQAQVTTGHCAQFIISVNESVQPVGCVFLKNIDKQSRKAEFGIFIGEDAARGKGYGAEAAHLIVEYGFRSLDLNRIYLTVLSNNTAAIASYERAGFRKEGLLHQDFFCNGQYYNVVMMARLANDGV